MSDIVNIPGRDIVALLRNEARRKPAIAALLDQAQTMTDAEIDSLAVPLPWYRKALKRARDTKISAATTENMLQIVANSVVDLQLNDRNFGSMRRYDGDTRFILVTKAGGSLEVKTGKLLWFPDDGGVWIDTIFAEEIDPSLAHSTFIVRNKRSDYISACAEMRNGAKGFIPHTVVDGRGSASMSDDRGLFTIHRH